MKSSMKKNKETDLLFSVLKEILIPDLIPFISFPNTVSKTYWKPISRAAEISFQLQLCPIFSPKHSSMEIRQEGVTCKIKISP
jgi:hypothetical protein